MARYKIKNVSGVTKNYNYGDIANNAEWEFPSSSVQDKLSYNQAFIDDIESEGVIVLQGAQELSPGMGIAAIKHEPLVLRSSFAVDKDGTDQSLSSANGWELLTYERIIWDLNSDYDTSTNDFLVPVDAIYKQDLKLRIKNISSNCSEIEVAVFLRGTPDDYWFIIDRKHPEANSLTEVILSGAVSFDYYQDERYCVKIKLTASSGTATGDVDGSDDYSAWGYDLIQKL